MTTAGGELAHAAVWPSQHPMTETATSAALAGPTFQSAHKPAASYDWNNRGVSQVTHTHDAACTYHGTCGMQDGYRIYHAYKGYRATTCTVYILADAVGQPCWRGAAKNAQLGLQWKKCKDIYLEMHSSQKV